MASKIYLDKLPQVVKENHKHNDKYYTATPLHPAVLVQDANFPFQDIKFLIDLLASITKQPKIRVSVPKKFRKLFKEKASTHITLKTPLPLWAEILSYIPFLANAAYASLDFKNLGNFVVSIGTGPNLFVVPHITTFHIAVINKKLRGTKSLQFALVRPEIVVVLNNRQTHEYIKAVRKQSLGKPTFYVEHIEQLKPIIKKALSIYNKMPFRWVEDLKEIKQE